MGHGNLLRHIFRHGSLLSKSKTDALPPKATNPENSAYVAEPVAKPVETAAKQLPRTPPRTPERNSHTVEVLPEILEESDSSPLLASGSPSITITTATSTRTLLAPVTTALLDITTFTTRDLLYAAIDEATAATNAHLDTIETTLAVLQALNGFSATIDLVKREMLEKERACENKLEDLESLEEAVEGMRFVDEMLERDGGEMGEVERERESARRALEGGK
jgi:hypothetical protein